MFAAILPLLSGLVSPVVEMVKGWQARKAAKLESDLAICKAKTDSIIHRLETQQAADIAWENTSIQNSGWKDEWFTILLSVPAILCFVPGLVGYVRDGFAALEMCPEWYRYAFLVAVASAFGYKKLADFMNLKKGASAAGLGAVSAVIGAVASDEKECKEQDPDERPSFAEQATKTAKDLLGGGH